MNLKYIRWAWLAQLSMAGYMYYEQMIAVGVVVSVLLINLAMLVLYASYLASLVEKHQKALRWFADHVYETPRGLKEVLPEELEDLVKPD